MTKPNLTRQVGATSVFTALVCVATISFTVYVPSTKGYFNIGETMIYTAAILFGPFVGAFSGGVGSMLADTILGYYYYAPATLVIKAFEGFIVGFLSKKGQFLAKAYTKRELRLFAVKMGVLVGSLVGLVGFIYYSGFVELYSVAFSMENPALTFFIPAELWFGVGVLAVLMIAVFVFISEPEYGFTIISCIFGGLSMVLGYFLYQQFFLGVFAIAEVPVNIGQMAIGLIVAIPLVRVVKRALPQLKS
ncbi:MAG: ECF transporter S component [Candidatus Bathyarchaeota archaeon]|nr:ECF transporter S component [Candidatus Bathyarchaeota archaeon]MDW8040539.1 ECF transporter S component [Nitrososphaerota archaeon]